MSKHTPKSKIDIMFTKMSENVSSIISKAPTSRIASENITTFVTSETTTRSKTMLTDMYGEMAREVIESLPDILQQNRFFEADLGTEIFQKYNFEIPKGGDFQEINRLYPSIVAGGGAIVIGSVLVRALSIPSPAISIALIVAASITAFCASYFKVAPDMNKAHFNKAMNKYLLEIKLEYIAWFDEIEGYFNTRVDEIKGAM